MVNRYTKAPPSPCPCCQHAPASSTVRQQHSPPGARETAAATPPLAAGPPSPQASPKKNAAGCGLVSQQPAARGMHPGRAHAKATGAVQQAAAPAQGRSDHQALQAGKSGNGKDDRNNGDLVLTRHGMSFQKNKSTSRRNSEEKRKHPATGISGCCRTENRGPLVWRETGLGLTLIPKKGAQSSDKPAQRTSPACGVHAIKCTKGQQKPMNVSQA